MSFWGELRRRNVVRVGIAYVVVAWLVIQVADTFFPALQLPAWTITFVAALLILGFPVALTLSWAYELTPEGIKRSHEVAATESITPVTGRRIDRVIIAVLALAVVFLVLDNYVLEEPDSDVVAREGPTPERNDAGGAAAAANTENARPTLANSVAVLPCENQSPNPDDAWFAAGIHQDILDNLHKLSALNPIARASVLQYAEDPRPIREIAAELAVESVMTCSVRFAGDDILVTAQLIDPVTSGQLWSDSYPGDLRNVGTVFAIQADISMNIANALRAEFSRAEQEDIEEAPTSQTAAYALYLQAREQWQTASIARDAVQALLDRAIAIDPQFARAYGLKASLYVTALGNNTLGSGVSAEDRAALIAQVRDYAGRALAIDPAETQARDALRNIYIPEWRWSEFRAALEPRDYDGLTAQSLWIISWMNDHAEAIRIGRRNARINPNQLFAHLSLGVVLAYAGQHGESNDALEATLGIAPAEPLAHHWLAFNAIATGDTQTGLRELRIVEQLLGDNRLTVWLPELAYAYSRLGEAADVARLIAELEARGDELAIGLGTWAMAYLAAGDEARALELLEAAAAKAARHEVDLGFLQLMNLRMNPLNDPRLEEPRFANVLERIRGD